METVTFQSAVVGKMKIYKHNLQFVKIKEKRCIDYLQACNSRTAKNKLLDGLPEYHALQFCKNETKTNN